MEYLRRTPTKTFWSDVSEWNQEGYAFDELKNTQLEKNNHVVIIGSGFTGLSIAYWLTAFKDTQPSNIVILESDYLCRGATSRNGGHCWPSLFSPSENESENEQIRLANEWIIDSSSSFIQYIQDNNIPCNLYKTGALNGFRFEEEIESGQEYLEELETFRMNMLENSRLLTDSHCNSHLESSYFKGGVIQDNAWQLWPLKVMYFMATHLLTHGVKIRTRAHVTSVQHQDNNHIISFLDDTDALQQIESTHVVYATNAYTKELLPQLEGVITPVRGQIIATTPMERFTNVSLSINDGYEYLIQRRDDLKVIYGGMRWRTETKEVNTYDDSITDETISEALRDSLKEISLVTTSHEASVDLTSSPGQDNANSHHNGDNTFSVTHEWTGIMGYSCDKRALIGRLIEGQNTWISAGYTGNGMPQCFGAGKIIAELITGRRDHWLSFFDPKRFECENYLKKHQYEDVE